MRVAVKPAALVSVLLVLILGWGSPAYAPFDTFGIHEVYSDATGTIQFIELRELFNQNNQHLLSGHTVTSNSKSIPLSNLPSNQTASKKVLLGTAAYAALPGAVPPDFIIPSNFFSVNGDTLTYAEGISTLTFTASQLPRDGMKALMADFTIAVNSPTNFAGQAGVIAAAPPPPAVGGDPRVKPTDFRVTVFATGLHFPYGMQRLSDGSLLVGTSDPSGGGLSASVGELRRLVDADGDGVADGPGAVLYTGLPGRVTSVRLANGFVLVASAQLGSERISVLRTGPTPADPYTLVGSLDFAFPPGWAHQGLGLAVRPTPGEPGAHDVFFSLGAEANDQQSAATVTLSGLVNAAANGASIYKVTLRDVAGTPAMSDLTQIASGLRNAAGIALDPLTGDLYFDDAGIDTPADPTQPLSADELNAVTAAAIGGASEDYGFPADYIEYGTGAHVGSGGIQPLATFQPIGAPPGSESRGPAEIVFAPPQFPTGLNRGIFAGFHGRLSDSGLANDRNPLVFYDLATGVYFHFIGNTAPNVGHPVGLLATENSLFVADLSRLGTLETSAPAGVIYQIRALPDLVVSALTAPSTSGAGKPITVTATVKNQGPGPAGPSTVQLHLSVNKTLGPGDVLLGSRSVPALGPGATSVGSTPVTIPPDTATGKFNILAIADTDPAVVVEISETNNLRAKAITIGPDLKVTALSAPSSAAVGASVTVTDTTKNTGGGAAGSSRTLIYLSADSTVGPGDTLLVDRQVPGLDPGVSNVASTPVTIPSVAPGPYVLIAVSDADNTVVETSESNNKKTRSITITAP